jgi:diguanylate cyclase (GGDEF)-like protein
MRRKEVLRAFLGACLQECSHSLKQWCAICTLWILALCACSAQAVVEPLRLNNAPQNGSSLAEHSEYYIERGEPLTLQEIRTQKIQRQFVSSPRPLFVPAGSRGVWMAVHLRQTSFDGNWVVSLPYTSLKRVSFYGPIYETGREMAEPIHTGSLAPFDTRPLSSEMFSMDVPLELPGEYTVYIRTEADIDRTYELEIWDHKSYFSEINNRAVINGFCYGIIFGLLVYNCALAFVFKDHSYTLYVLSGAFAFLSLLAINGHLAKILLPDSPLIAYRMYAVFPALWLATAAAFAGKFLDLKKHTPTLNLALVAVILIGVCNSIVAALGHMTLAQFVNERISLIGALLVAGVAAYEYRKGFKPAKIYLTGQLSLFVSVIITILGNWGFDIPHAAVNYSLQFGISAEMLIFALALSNRIQHLKGLERSLTSQAKILSLAAETDPLTGLLNRAGLKSRADEILINSRRSAVVLLDLDRFKPVNDEHGHQAGDALLVEIAVRLRINARPTDVIARIGGDEFVLIIAEPQELSHIDGMLRRLLRRISEPLTSNGVELSVGASMGVAFHPENGKTLDELLNCADAAMYQVKRNGRDGVAYFDDVIPENRWANSRPGKS